MPQQERPGLMTERRKRRPLGLPSSPLPVRGRGRFPLIREGRGHRQARMTADAVARLPRAHPHRRASRQGR